MTDKMRGVIYKGIGSFYTVHGDDGGEYVCKACGRFRKEHIIPLVGDRVEFSVKDTGHSFITDICKRKNVLVRPAVANLDKLIIVMSATVPKADFYLTDKLLSACEQYKITPVIVINKCDADEGGIAEITSEYDKTGYRILLTSAESGEGVERLRSEMAGCVSCFAGQSAVGKTSLLNRLMPGLSMQTGDLSRKTERGKHTTRHVELWETGDGGAVLDTPGFSLLELQEQNPEKLSELYAEMKGRGKDCRFSGCVHISEPDCAVKEAVASGEIPSGRYARYVSMYNELAQEYKHRYDKAKLH